MNRTFTQDRACEIRNAAHADVKAVLSLALFLKAPSPECNNAIKPKD